MNTFKAVVKILAALAAVAGAIYLIATYGDKIVAWAKKLLKNCPCCNEAEPVAEEVPAEEAPADAAPVAEDSDFEG